MSLQISQGTYVLIPGQGYAFGVEAVNQDGSVELHVGELHEPSWQTVEDARRFALKLVSERYSSVKVVSIETPGIGPAV